MVPSTIYTGERTTHGGTHYTYKNGDGIRNNDPYVYPNGTLINNLGITDYNELREEERKRLSWKILSTEMVNTKSVNMHLLEAIHEYIFEEFFTWAGNFRTIPIIKIEDLIIPTKSINYVTPDRIVPELRKAISGINSIKRSKLNRDELIWELVLKTAKIWKIHPFRDGNTRTILGFVKAVVLNQGFEFDMNVCANLLSRPKNGKGEIIGYSIRDMFVYATLDEKPEYEYLISVFEKAISTK